MRYGALDPRARSKLDANGGLPKPGQFSRGDAAWLQQVQLMRLGLATGTGSWEPGGSFAHRAMRGRLARHPAQYGFMDTQYIAETEAQKQAMQAQCAPGEKAVQTSDGAGGYKWVCAEPPRQATKLEESLGFVLYGLGPIVVAAGVGVLGWLAYSRWGRRSV